jgi:hypothetical protein
MPKSFLFTHKRYDPLDETSVSDPSHTESEQDSERVSSSSVSNSHVNHVPLKVLREKDFGNEEMTKKPALSGNINPEGNSTGPKKRFGVGPFQKVTKLYAERYLAETNQKNTAASSSSSLPCSQIKSHAVGKSSSNSNLLGNNFTSKMCIRVPELIPTSSLHNKSHHGSASGWNSNRSSWRALVIPVPGNHGHRNSLDFGVREVNNGREGGAVGAYDDDQPVNLSVKKVDLFNLNQLAEVSP